jgi:plasmid stabilization system protein ParE
MRVAWTAEALDDFEQILAYYHREVGTLTAHAIEARIVAEIEALRRFPERIRKSGRVADARELVVRRLPCIVFVRVRDDEIVVLNIVHTARRFPGQARPR